MIGAMPMITLDVPDELKAVAERRGHASLAALFEEVVADLLYFEIEVQEAESAEAALPAPPPEVLAEVRRRQATPLSDCRPMEEFFDELEARIKARIAAADAPQEARA